MHTVCHQRLRLAEKAAQHLQYSQYQIDENAHPSAFSRGGEAHRMGGLESG